jgi:hypothetical protein
VNSGRSLFHRFTFNKIYPPKTEQEEVFNNMVLPKLKEFFEGRNQVWDVMKLLFLQVLYLWGREGGNNLWFQPGSTFSSYFKSVLCKARENVQMSFLGVTFLTQFTPL